MDFWDKCNFPGVHIWLSLMKLFAIEQLLYFYTEKLSASNILSYLCFTKDTAKIQSPMKLVKNYFQMFTD